MTDDLLPRRSPRRRWPLVAVFAAAGLFVSAGAAVALTTQQWRDTATAACTAADTADSFSGFHRYFGQDPEADTLADAGTVLRDDCARINAALDTTTTTVAPTTTTSSTTTTTAPSGETPWPDSASDGVGLAGCPDVPRPVRADRTLDTPGEVVENVTFTDRVHVWADNVTIRCVIFDGASIQAVYVEAGSGLTVEDSVFRGGWEKGIDAASHGDHVTIRRVAMWDVWRCGDPSPNGVIEDVWCTPNVTTGSDAHTSGWGTGGGTDHVIIRRSYTVATSTHTSTALPIYNDYGTNDDWLVTDSYWDCTCSYTMYPGGSNTNIRIIGNTLGSHNYYGYVHSWSGSRVNGPDGNERGNVWDRNVDDVGNPISL